MVIAEIVPAAETVAVAAADTVSGTLYAMLEERPTVTSFPPPNVSQL